MEREQGELIKPVRVNVTSICPLEFPPGLSVGTRMFWWSHYGFQPQFEDLLQIQSADKKVDYGAWLYTKGYVRETLGKKDTPEKRYLAERYQEQIQEKFGRGIDALLREERILFSRQFQPEPLVLQEVNQNGKMFIIPSYTRFSIYHPAEYETFDVVEQAVRRFGREYANIPFSEILMVKERPSEQEARQAYEEYKREVEEYKKQKREVKIPPGYLALLVSQKEVDRYPEIESGIVASNVRGNGLDFYAELKDGSRYPIGKPRLHVLKKGDG